MVGWLDLLVVVVEWFRRWFIVVVVDVVAIETMLGVQGTFDLAEMKSR